MRLKKRGKRISNEIKEERNTNILKILEKKMKKVVDNELKI